MGERQSRIWHTVTAVVTAVALLLQLGLTIAGGQVLDETEPMGLGERVFHFFSYFTIQSNVLVAVGTALLALDPLREGRGFRSLRMAGLLGITVTGIVHFFLLRPLVDLDGLDYLADKLLHVAVPLLAVVGWLLCGPRSRFDARALAVSIGWPIAYLGYVLVVGAASGWYPYPFVDVDENGWAHVLVAALGITGLFLALAAVFWQVDTRARPLPRPFDPYRDGPVGTGTP